MASPSGVSASGVSVQGLNAQGNHTGVATVTATRTGTGMGMGEASKTWSAMVGTVTPLGPAAAGVGKVVVDVLAVGIGMAALLL